MPHILILEPIEKISKQLKIQVSKNLKLTPIISKNLEEATEKINILSDLVLILGPTKLAQDLKMLSVYANTRHLEIPVFEYQDLDHPSQIITNIALKLNIKINTNEHEDFFNYHGVDLSLVYDIESPCDLYIKIGSTEVQFIKRVSAFEHLDEQLYQKLIGFSVSKIYIHNDDKEIFYRAVTNKHVEYLNLPEESLEKTLKFQMDAFKLISQISNELTLDHKIIEITNAAIDSVQKTLLAQVQYSKIIQTIINQKQSIHFQVFYLTNLISCSLLKREDFELENSLEKYVRASLFCDLGLEKEKIFFINSKDELEKMLEQDKITIQQFKKVNEHARLNSLRLDPLENENSAASNLILHHHGTPSGIGLEDNPKEIPLDSKIFYTANTFIKYFLNTAHKFNKKIIVQKQLLRFARDPEMRRLTEHLSLKID
jgi:hypothetical protein